MTETGTVKWYSLAKGYGFIRRDSDGTEIFVHHSGIADQGSRRLHPEERVSFEVSAGPRGLLARNVAPR